MSRPKRPPIDPQGHAERPGLVPAAIRCDDCEAVRLKDRNWLGPCPGPAERSSTPVLGCKEPLLRGGLYRGTTKQGG